MNYYERHLGDFAKDTAHLSALEVGVYDLLIDRYYSTEEPIPQEHAHRVARARTKDEKAAADAVLGEFFKLTDGRWVHNRIEREIERFKDGEPEREAKKANEQARLKRHRDERAKLFQAITAAGEHAAWNASMSELRAFVKRLQTPTPTTAPETAPETPATATRHQTPSTKQIHSEAIASGGPPPNPPDASDQIFALGPPLLTAAGVTDKNARSMLGLMRKTHGDDALLRALGRMAVEKPIQPVPWLQAALGPRPASTGKHTGFEAKNYREGVTEDGRIA